MLSLSPKTIAILIDAENISHVYCKNIFSKASSYGKITIKKAYGHATSLKSWQESAFQYGIEPELCPQQVSGKGGSDMAMAIGAMDLTHREIVNTICLVSSDSDFSRLATSLRNNGVEVYGMGSKNTLNSYIQSCTDFYQLETEEEKSIPQMLKSAYEDLKNQKADGEGWINLRDVADYIKKQDPELLRNSNQKLSDMIESDGFLEYEDRVDEGMSVGFMRKKDREREESLSKIIVSACEKLEDTADADGWIDLARVGSQIKSDNSEFFEKLRHDQRLSDLVKSSGSLEYKGFVKNGFPAAHVKKKKKKEKDEII